MVTTAAVNRFGVGLVSAMVVPAIKLAQNGVTSSAEMSLLAWIGFSIPIIVLAVVTGFYAVFVESKETDMKRLFRMCMTLPAFVTMIASGGDNVPEVEFHATTKAEAAEPELKKIECSSEIGMKLGLKSAMGMLTNKKYKRFWLLSDEPVSNRCVMVEKACMYIVKSTDTVKPNEIYMDKFTCKIEVKE